MNQTMQPEKTIWRDEKWRVTLKPRTNNPGYKAVAYFKDIRVASYDETGLHDHQDGVAIRRIPIRGDVEDIMHVAYKHMSISRQPRVFA